MLGAGGDIAQAGVKGGVEGGDQGHPQLLAKVGKPEVEGGEGEAGVHQIRPQPLERFAKLPLGTGGGDRVNLRFHQVGQGYLGPTAQPIWPTTRTIGAIDPELFGQGGWGRPTGWGVEMDKADPMAPASQGMGGAEAVGDIAAKRRFLA